MASDVPTTPVMPAVWSAKIKATQEELARGEFSLHSVPGYVPGQPPTIAVWQHMDYLDIYPRVYGRECGANGIGTLREVALSSLLDDGQGALRAENPEWFPRSVTPDGAPDPGLLRGQSDGYQAALEAAGVLVHRVDVPDTGVSPYGPSASTLAMNQLLVLRGGSVIEKPGVTPLDVGRSGYLALWAWSRLGIVPVASIQGKGVAEAGSCVWLAEDVFVTGGGLTFNQAGLDQLLPMVAKSAALSPDAMTVLRINSPGATAFHRWTGQSHHPDVVVGALDVDKVIVYAAGLDHGTWNWLHDNGYGVVEVERDEQAQFLPCNLTVLEPGRVMMPAEAVKAVAAVRKLGVDVVEVPYSEFGRTGVGLATSTLRIARDKGPFRR
jgi:N-dimethylarginine dimethylaminohydrolase